MDGGDQLTRFPINLFLIVLVSTAVAFIASGCLMGDFGAAWDVLIGTRSPFGSGNSAAGVVLSALGYLFVPASIGLVVADVVMRHTRRPLQPLSGAQADVGEIVHDAPRLKAEPQRPKGTRSARKHV